MRISVAAAGAAGVAFGAWYLLDELFGRSLGAQILSVGTGVLAGTAAYLGLAALIRVRELQTLLSLRRRSATTSEE